MKKLTIFHKHNQVCFEQDDIDENGMQKMEEARIAYVAAVATAKENPSEESIAAAAEARVHLQAYLFNCHQELHCYICQYVT